jgi:hypothetical protein
LQRVADNNGDHRQVFSLDKQRFPFVFHSKIITVNNIEIFGVPRDSPVPVLNLTLTDPEGQTLNLISSAIVGSLVHKSADANVEVKKVGDNRTGTEWTVQVKKADLSANLDRLEDLLVLCHYSVRE